MNSFHLLNAVFLICFYEQGTYGLLNGLNITNGQFAAHVILFLPNGRVCGGELISSTHILTASSCVFNEYNELFAPTDILVCGQWNITSRPVVPYILNIYVAAIYAHPKYDPYSKENDIAVLRLPAKLPLESNILVPSIARAELASRIVPDETLCTLAGYAAADVFSGLMFIRLPIFNRIECNQNGEYTFRIKDSMICAGVTSDMDVCSNDIGSGLYCNGVLSGILSFGAECDGLAPGVFTQVRMYSEWIKRQLWRYDTPKAGPTPPPTNKTSTLMESLMLLWAFLHFIYVVII